MKCNEKDTAENIENSEKIIQDLIIFLYEKYLAEIETQKKFSQILDEIHKNKNLRNDKKFMKLVKEIEEIEIGKKEKDGKIFGEVFSYQAKK